jgi:hypothetical protein
MDGTPLDISKRVFLSPGCLKNKKILDYILKVLEDHEMPKNRIIQGIDLDLLSSNDYLIRCLDEKIQLFKVQLSHPFGFTTHLEGNL